MSDGNRDAHHLAVVGRVQAEVRRADRLLDRAELRRIERLRDDQRRLGNRQAGQLVERHLRAVGLDVDAVEDRHRRAAGPHAGQFVAHVLERRVHPLVDFGEQALQVVDIHCRSASPIVRRLRRHQRPDRLAA